MTAEDSSGGPVEIPAAGGSTNSSDPADPPGDDSAQLLRLTVQHPAAGVCVVMADGELDMLTASLFDTCVREHLAAGSAHLILDLQAVSFMGSRGLNCLLQARELALQTPGTQLHLAGLVTRVVARPLEITALLELFDIYPTLTDALDALAS